MELIDVIQQRKTIKTFNPHAKISRVELEEMLRLAQLAPSKANLQPWRYVSVDDKALKAKLLPHVGHNVPPCETAPLLLLVLADLQYDQLLPALLDKAVAEGCLAPQFKENQLQFLQRLHQANSSAQIRDQVLIDASLSAMQFMLIAKEKGFDTHAIGVFDRPAVLEILQVDATRYAPLMLIAVGKAATNPIPTARLDLDYTLSWNDGNGFK